MKEKQVYKKIWPLPVKNFKKLFLWHQAVHIMYLNVDRQGCVIKTVAYSLRTDRHRLENFVIFLPIFSIYLLNLNACLLHGSCQKSYQFQSQTMLKNLMILDPLLLPLLLSKS